MASGGTDLSDCVARAVSGFCMRPPVAVLADVKGCKSLVACNPTPLQSVKHWYDYGHSP